MKVALCLVFCLGLALARVDQWERRNIYDADSCHVRDSTLKTFDNNQRQLHLSTQFKVLAQDCSDSQRCVVLIRKLNEITDLKQVKIICDGNNVLITPTSDAYDHLRILINGQEQQISEINDFTGDLHQLPIRVYREGSHINVELLNCDITVRFNGQTCKVQKSSRQSTQLCGLCGKTSSEQYNQYDDLFTTYEQDDQKVDPECRREHESLWGNLYQDEDDQTVSPLRSSGLRRHQDRRHFGQSRRPTFWGLNKEDDHNDLFSFFNKRQHSRNVDQSRSSRIWDLLDQDKQDHEDSIFSSKRRQPWDSDKESRRSWFDTDAEEVFPRKSIYDDWEVPSLRSSKHQQRRNFLGQSRRASNFWDLDEQQRNNYYGHDNQWENTDSVYGSKS